jgi:hypothetical protein
MPTPTVPFQILHKGYQVSGDSRSGYTASVPYLVEWKYAFTFADQLFGVRTASVVGPITFMLPYRFPAANANMYAQKFTIEPCGHNGEPLPVNKGLEPGETFTHAIIKVEFGMFQSAQGQEDDPDNMHQLDKDNPITKCKQAVKTVAKMETKKGGSYLFTGGAAPLKGDVAVPVPEASLELTFPDVPYLPWKYVKPFIGTVNSDPMLGSVKGELLLEGMDTEVVPTKDGIAQQVVLKYNVGPFGDWNKLPNDSGTPTLVWKKGTSDTDANRIYAYKDHRQIFDTITYGPLQQRDPLRP